MPSVKFDDVAFLKDVNRWPNWPICPVKRYENVHSFPLCGVTFATDTKPMVKILNMFGGWSQEEFDKAKTFNYNSIEEMVADGWVVD